MKRSFASLFGRSVSIRRRPAAARRLRLALEPLEARELLTVFFTPNFGGSTTNPGISVNSTDWRGDPLAPVTIDGSPLKGMYNTALKSPQVYVIFSNDLAGTGWDWSKHTADEQTVLTSVSDILSNSQNSFLSGLAQYGYDNKAMLVTPVAEVDSQAFTFNPLAKTPFYPFNSREADLQNYIFGPKYDNTGALSRLGLSPPAQGPDEFHVPIFLVVTAPGANVVPEPNLGGFNTFDNNSRGAYAWVSTSLESSTTLNTPNGATGGIVKDQFTSFASHELAEAISHELELVFPPNEVSSLNTAKLNQVADGEANQNNLATDPNPGNYAGNYTARLTTGELVQAYWSTTDQQFIVPDGTTQKTFRTPVWTPNNQTLVSVTEVPTTTQVASIGPVLTPDPSLLAVPANDIVDFNGREYRAWTNDEDIYIQESGQAPVELFTAGAPGSQTPENARGNPSLAVFNNQLFIAWTGTDHTGGTSAYGSLNVAVVDLADFAGGAVRGTDSHKVNLPNYTSSSGPALASFDNTLFLAFAGRSTGNPLFLDFINKASPTWGQHLTNPGGQKTDSPPAFALDRKDNKLVVRWIGTDSNNTPQAGFVNLVGTSGQPLVALSDGTGGTGGMSQTLTVDGNQYVGMNDDITIDQNAAGGVRVTLNGVVRDYNPGSLSQVVINTGVGTNKISLLNTPANVSVVINALGTTSVNVGSDAAIPHIQGDVSIWGPSHSVDLNLDYLKYRIGQNISLQSDTGVESVTGLSPNSTIRFGTNDLSKLTLQTGFGDNTVSVFDTPSTTTATNLDLNGSEINAVIVRGTTGNLYINSRKGQDSVTVYPVGGGDNGSVDTIKGLVNVINPGGSTTLVVKAGNDTGNHPNVKLDQGRLTGLSLGDIVWRPSAGLTGGVTSLAIYGGLGTNTFTVANTSLLAGGPTLLATGNGTNTINIQNTQGPLDVTLGTGTNTVNVSSSAHLFNTIQGNVTITGAAGHDSLWIYDSASNANSQYRLTATSVSSTGTATITYSALAEIHLVGGTGQEIYRAQDTAAGAATYLTTNSAASSTFGSTVIVTGTSGGLLVTGASGPTQVTVGTGTLQSINGNVLVYATGGKVQLDVRDWADRTAPTAVLGYRRIGSTLRLVPGQEALTSLAPADIAYYGDLVTPTFELGSGTLTVTGTGAQQTIIDADAGANVNVSGNQGPLQVNAIGGGLVTVGPGTLKYIKGTVRITSQDQSARLVVDGSSDSGSVGALTAGTTNELSGLSPASIFYKASQISPSIHLGPSASLTLTGARGVDPLGSLSVLGTGTSDQLTIDDHQGTGLPTGLPSDITSLQRTLAYKVTGKDVSRFASFVYFAPSNGGGGGTSSNDITYQGITNLVLDGSNVGATFNVTDTSAPTLVNGGTGKDSFTVGNLDNMGQLTVDGHGGGDGLTVKDQTGTGLVGLPAGATLTNRTMSYTLTSGDIRRNAAYGYSTSGGGGGGSSQEDVIYRGIAGLEVDGSNAGATFNVTSASIPTVVKGGAGKDTFAVTAAVSYTADGGGGVNTLDYTNFTGPVTVNLVLGTATGILGGISDFLNVTGGAGNDLFVGNGGNVLTGGTGRNVLIAGPRPSTLIGGPGEDVLVGGSTAFDSKPTALDAIMAEWGSTDLPYATRVSHLLLAVQRYGARFRCR